MRIIFDNSITLIDTNDYEWYDEILAEGECDEQNLVTLMNKIDAMVDGF